MTIKPTDAWREAVAEEAGQLASGELDPECACTAKLFPESLLTRTDEVLGRFETELAAIDRSSDEEVFGLVERVVLGLNEVQEEHDYVAYETDERELLCAYIDGSLTEAGIDVAALAARNGIGRHEITDRWREW